MSNSKPKNIRLLAIDPSLTASGWSLFGMKGGMPIAVGIIFPPGASLLLAERLRILQHDVDSLFNEMELGEKDILICEGPAPLIKNPDSAIKVEHVRGIFESLARARGVSVPGRLNPRTVQTELLGMRGKQMQRKDVKIWARNTVEKLYGPALEKMPIHCAQKNKFKTFPQDIVDALLIGTLAVSRVKQAIQLKQDYSSMFLVSSQTRSFRQLSVPPASGKNVIGSGMPGRRRGNSS